jgi:hypothetical protein
MDKLLVKEVETIIRIAWEGFDVHVWATDERDSEDNRLWYWHEDGLKFGRSTSKDWAIERGTWRLQQEILAANEAYKPHSQAFLDSIKDPFVEEVTTTIQVLCPELDEKIVAVGEPEDFSGRRSWKFRGQHGRLGCARSRTEAVKRAKRYLRRQLLIKPMCTCGYRHLVGDDCGPWDDDYLPF